MNAIKRVVSKAQFVMPWFAVVGIIMLMGLVLVLQAGVFDRSQVIIQAATCEVKELVNHLGRSAMQVTCAHAGATLMVKTDNPDRMVFLWRNRTTNFTCDITQANTITNCASRS